MHHNHLVLLAAILPTLPGCSSGGGGGSSGESNAFCHTIPVRAIACTDCAQVSEAGAAFDGQLANAASMLPGGQGTFLGTSDMQPGGSVAGVYFTLTNPAGVSVTLKTFKNGTEQETQGPATRQGVSDVCNNMYCSFNDGGGSFVGMDTTMDYDAIEATISNSSAGTLLINELCVR